jgi:uncharacterized protein YjiS (DUF1127 family)
MTMLSSLLQRTQQRRMYRTLLQLDDHLLKDIGFNRYALREVLAAHRSPSVDTRL